MGRTAESARWSMTTPAGNRVPSRKRERVSRRDLLTILAGSAAVAGIGIAIARSGGAHDGVALREGVSATSGASDLSPVDGNWDGMSARTESASPRFATSGTPEVPNLPLVARTEAEHIAQTQSFAGTMMPRLNAGEVTGFTIREGAMPPVFARAGVRTGDVVVSVNGRDLTSNAMVSGLSRDLAGARRVDLVVEREGKRETLSAALQG